MKFNVNDCYCWYSVRVPCALGKQEFHECKSNGSFKIAYKPNLKFVLLFLKWCFKHPLSKAVLQSLARCQVSYSLNFFRKYSISYCRNALHWINFCTSVFINRSYCNYIDSSFPEGARSYRVNHTWLPKKKDIESHKIDDLYEFSNNLSRDWMS